MQISYSHVPNKRVEGEGLIIVLAVENQKNNSPKTKNYTTEDYQKIEKTEVDDPQLIRHGRVCEFLILNWSNICYNNILVTNLTPISL